MFFGGGLYLDGLVIGCHEGGPITGGGGGGGAFKRMGL